METYSGFAGVYDEFMDDVPYERWAHQCSDILKAHGITDGIVCDLGCGTGTLTEMLAREGYDMIGIDNSEEMLGEALDKKYDSGLDILYLCQDMREFELYGTCRAIISRCDCLNYILTYEDLVRVFALVNNYLDPDGLFIFDINSEYKYREILGQRTFAEVREDAAFIWDNSYDPETGLNEYQVSFFTERADGLYERSDEVHVQRAWKTDEIMRAAEEAGLVYESLKDCDTDGEPDEETERYLAVFREHGKTDER